MCRKFAAVSLVLMILFSVPAGAHHSVAANFDQSKTMDITGVVKEVETKLNGATTCLCIDEVRPAG